MPEQPLNFRGLIYQPDLITPAEEQQALAVLEAMEFHIITMHGRTARRTVRHFGLDHGLESWQLVPTDPCPRSWPGWWSGPERWPGSTPQEFAQILVSR